MRERKEREERRREKEREEREAAKRRRDGEKKFESEKNKCGVVASIFQLWCI